MGNLTVSQNEIYAEDNVVVYNNEMGYVFLDDADYTARREQTGENATYFNLSINHGNVTSENPGSYAYVVLPNNTKEETLSFSENNTVEILLADESAHIVKDGDVIGANIFSAPVQISNICTAQNKMSVLINKKNDSYEFYVSDPTLLQDELVIVFGENVNLEKCDEEVSFSGNTVTIDTSAKDGKTYTFLVK